MKSNKDFKERESREDFYTAQMQKYRSEDGAERTEDASHKPRDAGNQQMPEEGASASVEPLEECGLFTP